MYLSAHRIGARSVNCAFVEVQRVNAGSRTQGTKDAYACCFSVANAVNCEHFCNVPSLVLCRKLQSLEREGSGIGTDFGALFCTHGGGVKTERETSAKEYALFGRRSKTLSRLLVPVDRQSYQGDCDDPEDDVFGAILFFGFSHKRSTAYLKSCFKCRSDFLSTPKVKASSWC